MLLNTKYWNHTCAVDVCIWPRQKSRSILLNQRSRGIPLLHRRKSPSELRSEYLMINSIFLLKQEFTDLGPGSQSKQGMILYFA